MVMLVCGILIMLLFVGLFVLVVTYSNNLFEAMPALSVFSLFICVSVYIIYKGIKKVKVDYKTSKYGKESFGKIMRMYQTGTNINGNYEYNGDILCYDIDHKIAQIYSDFICLGTSDYDVGVFVKIKLYEGDVNIISVVDKKDIPKDILKAIDTDVYNYNANMYGPINNNM